MSVNHMSNTAVQTSLWSEMLRAETALTSSDSMTGTLTNTIGDARTNTVGAMHSGLDPMFNQMMLPSLQSHFMTTNQVLLQSQQMLQNLNIGPEQTIWGGMVPTLMQQAGIQQIPPNLQGEVQKQMKNIQAMITNVQNIHMQMPPGYLRDYSMNAGLGYLQGMFNFWYPAAG